LPQSVSHLFVALSRHGRPQDFHRVAFTRDRRHTDTIHFKAGTRQEFILEIDQDIFLIAILSFRGFNLCDFKILIDIVALLTNGLDNGILKEFLALFTNILMDR
jgi:hypothetical protein